MYYDVKDIKLLFPSMLTGMIFVLSIAPFDLWFLAYIAFVPLLYYSFGASYRKLIALYSSTALIISVGWWHSVISYSFLTFCLISLVMCLSFISWGFLSKAIRDKWPGPFVSIFVTTFIWIGIERIHTSELIGVPGNIGISQYAQPLLIQSASLFGIYAVSFLVLLSNTIITYLLLMLKNPDNRSSKEYIYTGLGLIVLSLNILYGYTVIDSQKDQQATIKVAIVQPVIASQIYQSSWRNPDNRLLMKGLFDDLTLKAVDEDVQIIFWPEGGNGYLNMRIPELRNNLYRIAKQNNVNLLISSDDLDEQGRKYNSIFSISNAGVLLDRYDKVKLIPDAEASYTPGHGYEPISTSLGLVGAAVCYETNFPSIFRGMANQGAELLFASTSDAAFKRTALVLSHTNLSVFRAIENRKWMVHASNTGPSIIVSPSGDIVASSSLYKRQIITAKISALTEKSVFTRYGYIASVVVAAFVILLAVALIYRRFIEIDRSKIFLIYPTIVTKLLSKLHHYLPSLIINGTIHAALLVLVIVTSVFIVNKSIDDNTSFSFAFSDYINKQVPQDDIISDRFLQAKKNTCGPAVLAYILSYYGKEVLEHDLIPHMNLTDQGVSMLDLKKTSDKLGFTAVGLKANYPGLENQVLPVIGYINNSHYVVINRIVDGFIYMFDPIEGHVKVARNDFERIWNGYMMLVKTKPISEI